MKALAICGFILAGLSVVGGFVLSSNGSLPMEGFSAVIGGIVTAFLFVLPSTTLLVVLQVRDLLKAK
jgi:hypothetical protein